MLYSSNYKLGLPLALPGFQIALSGTERQKQPQLKISLRLKADNTDEEI